MEEVVNKSTRRELLLERLQYSTEKNKVFQHISL